MKNLLIFFISLGLVNCTDPVHAQQFTVDKTSDGVEVKENGKKVLFYQQSPKSLNGKYERAGYVHPLYGLDGTVLTEDFPDDHPHHRGIFWAWHQIIWHGGKIADGWLSENIDWVVKNIEIEKDDNKITLKPTRIWKSILSVKELKPIIRENTTITVHAAEDDFRLIDFEIQLKALVDGLKIGGSDNEKGYGGFSPRFNLPEDIQFISTDGTVDPKRTAVTAGPWMDFYGSFSGLNKPKNGIAVLNHPTNPEPHWHWILRSSGSMQNAVFPGRDPVKVTKEGITLRYRMVVHEGSPEDANIEQLYQDYKNNKVNY